MEGKTIEEDDDPHSIEMKDTIGDHVVQDKKYSSTAQQFRETLKMTKHNIGTKEDLKIAIIGDH